MRSHRLKRTARLRTLQRAALRIVSAREGARLDNGPRLGRRCAPPADGALIAAMVAGGCGASRPAGRAVAAGAPTVAVPARVRSNILRADYAGSARCASCHAEITAAWQGSPMHLMTRLPEGARIRAPFDGTTFRFKEDSAHLTEKDGARFVELDVAHRRPARLPCHARHRRPLSRRLRGGRGRRLGQRGRAARAAAPHPARFETKSFRLKGYSVLVTERPGLHAGGVWNQTSLLPQHGPLLR